MVISIPHNERFHGIISFGSNLISLESLFVVWLTFLGRLATWNPAIGTSCSLYDYAVESINHIYFDCPFSSTVWQAVVAKASYSEGSTARSWEAEATWAITNWKGKPLHTRLYSSWLSLHLLYIVRKELRTFQARGSSPSLVIDGIFLLVRFKVASIPRLTFELFSCPLIETLNLRDPW